MKTPYWPYWFIHGKLYDLEPWLDKHPGGADFLLRLQGTDCTAAFEIHHPDMETVRAMLQAYAIKTDDAPQASSVPQFNWQSYNELRRRVWVKLQAQNWQPGPSLRSRSIALVFLVINISIPFLWSSLGDFFWLLGFIYAVNLIYISGFGHVFLHLNTRWEYLGDLGGFSSYEWKGSHCLEHHLYVNHPQYDPDTRKLLPLLDFRPDHNTPWQPYAAFFVLPLYAIAFMALRFKIGINLFKDPQHFWSRLFLYVAGSFSWFILWGIAGHLWVGIFLEAVASFVFLSWTLTSHNHSSCHDLSREKDFIQYQLKASYDFGSSSYGSSLILGAFLGSQSLHHLFPTLDPVHYPIVEKELKAMGYTYQRHNFWRIYWDHLHFICR